MAKYTEAFCVTTGSMISIMQMRSEYNHAPPFMKRSTRGTCSALAARLSH